MATKIKVLHCLESIGSGGVEQRRLSMAKYLDKDRFEQALVCAKVKGDFDKRLMAEGTRVFPIGPMRHPFNFDYYKKLFKIIRHYRPDIIHGAVFEGVISAVIGGLLFRVPIIIVEETSEPANRSWRGHMLMRLLSKFAKKVVATSPAVYEYLHQQLGISKNKAVLVLNGVEPLPEPPLTDVEKIRKALNISSNDFIIGSAGRLLDDHKRFSDAIRAFDLLKDHIPQAKLLIVGDGTDRENLISFAKSLGLLDRIIFAGHQPDLRPYYKVMDVFILTSQREGFGMVVVEAMFMGLPVVASNVGGLPAIVVNDETGFLVKPLNPSEFSEKIIELYSDQSKRLKMGEAGKHRAEKVFHAKRYVNDVERVYKELLSKHGISLIAEK